MNRRIAVGLLLLLIAAAALVCVRSGYSYDSQDRDFIMAGVSSAHWIGTDQLGRDRATRMSVALLVGLSGATVASLASTGFAGLLGSMAVFSKGSVAYGLMLFNDVFLTLPWLFLLMIIRSGLPLTTQPWQSAALTFCTLAALGWPVSTRTIYHRTRQLQSAEWMIQARAGGLRRMQIVRRYLVPQLGPLLLTQFLVGIPVFLIAEANLGTLGLGTAEPLPSWGTMLLEMDQSVVLAQTHLNYIPIALLVLTLLLFEMITIEV